MCISLTKLPYVDPILGPFLLKHYQTIIKKHKNNNQMAQKLQVHANSQCVLEMIWQVFQLLFYRHVWFYRLNKMQNLCCFASLHLVWGLQKKRQTKLISICKNKLYIHSWKNQKRGGNEESVLFTIINKNSKFCGKQG